MVDESLATDEARDVEVRKVLPLTLGANPLATEHAANKVAIKVKTRAVIIVLRYN
jgi:hypothetical protein